MLVLSGFGAAPGVCHGLELELHLAGWSVLPSWMLLLFLAYLSSAWVCEFLLKSLTRLVWWLLFPPAIIIWPEINVCKNLFKVSPSCRFRQPS